MANASNSAVWRCAHCRCCGLVPLDKHSSIVSIIAAIARDHAEKNPSCEAGEKEIHILSEGEAA